MHSEFHGFTINWQSGLLTKNGEEVGLLEPKMVAVLKVLFDGRGELVTYEQIQQHVWQDVVVAPNALQRVIASLRKAMGDSAKAQQIIKTHPKRGYSLVPEPMGDVQLQRVDQEKTHTAPRKHWMGGVFALCLVGMFFLWGNHISRQTVKVPEIISLDTQTDQLANITPIDETRLLFVDKQNGHQLVVHNTVTNQTEVKLQALKLYGELVLSDDKQAVRFGQVIEHNGVKCSALMVLELSSNVLSEILPCEDNFNHTPIKLNSNQLLYIKTNKRWQSQLMLLNLSTNESSPVFNGHNDTVLATLHANQVVIQQGNLLQIAKLLPTGTLMKSSSITLRREPDALVVTPNNHLLVALDNKLYTYSLSGELLSTSQLATSMKVSELAFAEQMLVALLGRENWQVHLNDVASLDAYKAVALSKFKDKNGQFRPQTQDISVLSNRGGTVQIWLHSDQHLKAITEVQQHDIDNYMWLDTNTLAYISNQRLWIKPLDKAAYPLDLDYVPVQLLQATGSRLYLKAEQSKQIVLMSLTLETMTSSTLMMGDFHWAQVIDGQTLLYNKDGTLIKRVAGKDVAIDAIPDLVLQGRYFNKNGSVYLQDKQQQVWRYQPLSESATPVGQYDENGLFMSDFSDSQSLMLSDNFIKTSNEVVKVIY